MIHKVIKKRDLQKFLRNLRTKKLYAPVKDEEGKIEFKLVNDLKEITFEFTNTLKPVKSLFIPQTETIFMADKKGIHTPKVSNLGVVFGVRPCDAKSIQVLTKVFEKDREDPYFLQKKKNLSMIGLACTSPGENCFCSSLGLGPFSTDGLDMLFADIGEKYYVEVVSKGGKKLVESNQELFSEPTKADRELRKKAQQNAEKKIARKLDVERVTAKLKHAFESAIWDEVSKICVGCGICTYLCPTCHCFDLTDELLEGKIFRVRTWDSCTFPYFTLQSSGHNPRPTRRERIRNRIYHKFQYLLENIGEIGCVGCGRCLENCPSGVNLIEVLSRVGES